jgi:hypothetical protein
MCEIAGSRGFKTEVMLTRDATRRAVLAKLADMAQACSPGDMALITYSGHGGQVPDLNDDEPDGLDETWCLFDSQLIEALSAFKSGVRVLVLSDSCHSGSVTKDMAVLAKVVADEGPFYRAMPRDVAFRVYQAERHFYDPILKDPAFGNSWRQAAASILLISGCQDNQLSQDGPFNGAFTGALKRVWNGGVFKGDYSDFHQEIQRRLPRDQSPNLFWANEVDQSFLAQQPFTIGAAGQRTVLVPQQPAVLPAQLSAKEKAMSDCLVTLQIKNLDMSNEANIWTFCQSVVPSIVQEIKTASSAKSGKGCSVSGSISGGSGGTSATGTITCTF